MECYESKPERPDQVAIGRDRELDEVFAVDITPDGKLRPVTVGEILYGDGSGGPPMGIMATIPPSELRTSPHRLVAGLAMALAAVGKPIPSATNRAKRRAERKRERQARKRGRR